MNHRYKESDEASRWLVALLIDDKRMLSQLLFECPVEEVRALFIFILLSILFYYSYYYYVCADPVFLCRAACVGGADAAQGPSRAASAPSIGALSLYLSIVFRHTAHTACGPCVDQRCGVPWLTCSVWGCRNTRWAT